MIRAILLVVLFAACVVPAGMQAQWTKTRVTANPNAMIDHMCTNGSDVYVSSNDTVYWSSDNGVTWSIISGTLPAFYIKGITAAGNSLFVAGDGTFASTTNNGSTWTSFKNSLHYTYAIAVHNDTLYVGAAFGVYFSTDLGATWNVKGGILASNIVYSLAFVGSDIFAGTHTNVSRLSPGSVNWVPVTEKYFTNYECDHIATLGSTLYAAFTGDTDITKGLFFKSTDLGQTWSNADNGKLQEPLYAVVVAGTHLLVSTWGGVFQSTDDVNWVGTFGFDHPTYTNCLAANSEFVFAGDGSGNVWRRAISNLDGVKDPNNAGDPIVLSPNPARDFLTIQNLPEDALNVVVENMLGQCVLATQSFGPSLKLDLLPLPRGSYLVRLGTSDGLLVRKVVKD